MQDPILDDIDTLAQAAPTDDKMYRAARSHSRRVTLMKWALPLAALGGLLWMGADLFLGRAIPEGVNVELTSTVIDEGNLVMANPEVTGHTSDDRPYRLIAERAIQAIGNDNAIDMEGIRAEFELSGGEKAHLQSPQGAYDRTANHLVLQGESVFVTDQGMEIRFTDAQIDVEAGSFVTSKPVQINRDGTFIRANSMRIGDSGKDITFEGGVKLIIEPGSLPDTAGNDNQGTQ